MKYYISYMKTQQVSPEFHQRLLGLAASAAPSKVPANRRRVQWAALAACCALAAGVGLWRLAPPPQAAAQSPAVQSTDLPGVPSPDPGGKLMFPNLPAIRYTDVTGTPQAAADLALPEGSFDRALTEEQIQELFWGSDGKSTAENTLNLPWTLFWDEYALTGRATYDGYGQLFWLHLWGQHPDGAEFSLELAPGRLPPSCVVHPDLEQAINIVHNTRCTIIRDITFYGISFVLRQWHTH